MSAPIPTFSDRPKAAPTPKLRALVKFPGNIVGTTGIEVTKANGTVTIETDWTDFGAISAIPTSPTSYILTFDTATGAYILVPSHLLGGAVAGLADAPIDGTQYARNSGAWTTTDFLQAGTGAVRRTMQNKARDIFSVKDFGALGDGSDATAAFNAALAAVNTAGGGAIFVPAGNYVISSTLVMPAVFKMRMYGEGETSVIQAKPGITSFDLITWNPPSVSYAYHRIDHLTLNGASNTGNAALISTAGMGGMKIHDLHIEAIPLTGAGIFTNGKDGEYNHDVFISNIYIDTETGGFGIVVGHLASDSTINGVVIQGRGVLQNGIYFDTGAAHIKVIDTHPYNCAVATCSVNGDADSLWFNGCMFDGTGATYCFFGNGMTKCTFTSCEFTFSGVGNDLCTLINCTDNNFSNSNFEGAGTARWGVNESGTSDRNTFHLCNFVGAFTSGPATLIGPNSTLDTLGKETVIAGSVAVSGGQEGFIGFGVGNVGDENAVQVLSPYDGYIRKLMITSTGTPGAGQVVIARARVNNVDMALASQINAGGFSAGPDLAMIPVSAGSAISIKIDISAGAALNTIRRGAHRDALMTELRSWLRDNSTLVYFLVAQGIAIGAAVLSMTAYMTRLESRTATLEIRGSPHLQEIDRRLTVLESLTRSNKESIDRVVTALTKGVGDRP